MQEKGGPFSVEIYRSDSAALITTGREGVKYSLSCAALVGFVKGRMLHQQELASGPSNALMILTPVEGNDEDDPRPYEAAVQNEPKSVQRPQGQSFGEYEGGNKTNTPAFAKATAGEPVEAPGPKEGGRTKRTHQPSPRLRLASPPKPLRRRRKEKQNEPTPCLTPFHNPRYPICLYRPQKAPLSRTESRL